MRVHPPLFLGRDSLRVRDVWQNGEVGHSWRWRKGCVRIPSCPERRSKTLAAGMDVGRRAAGVVPWDTEPETEIGRIVLEEMEA